ncbi:hypothetical protein NBH00_03070 [Paraconexibacter antarcticus]|uniref:ARG and Rhodanese-Phosphatase-superfamily-associated domain-containing protein n=1 Tax=Paraconexibacter antarcticus TaxID=2949664 RepID=A0ABY5DT53_9ACTN|nr:DUF6569 family protein [Paraconexibacter antarcticus]UTI65198.1 hypothetical protein NBH00_03070 [Paraconexibacter antarcticus]
MPAPVLTAEIRVGAPQTSGALTVFPLFAAGAPRLEYRSFAQAAAEGFVVRELKDGASVNDLVVHNPLGVAVLLYDGEEVSGAQQNRTLDRSVLVPAGAEMTVPVSCVEAGRWDGARHDESFSPAPQAAYPSLRAMKHRQVTTAVSFGAEARADQSAVWDEVAAKSARRGAHSPTGAMADVFDHDRGAIDAMVAAVARQDGQVGAVAAVHGGVAVLDYVSRSDVWAALHGPLVQGYALDALDARGPGLATVVGENIDTAWVQDWVDGFLHPVEATTRRAAGLGEDVALGHGMGATGTALCLDGELIQLSGFPPVIEDGPRGSRIRRPSPRR